MYWGVRDTREWMMVNVKMCVHFISPGLLTNVLINAIKINTGQMENVSRVVQACMKVLVDCAKMIVRIINMSLRVGALINVLTA